ncbi:MAG TPA: toluene-4-monooxygenase system B family protein [Kofleriaceae bacterium]
MTAIPLYCFVAGDSLGVLVLVHAHDTVAELALRAQQAAAVRVEPRTHACVFAQGSPLDRAATVKEVGLVALDRVDVRPEER